MGVFAALTNGSYPNSPTLTTVWVQVAGLSGLQFVSFHSRDTQSFAISVENAFSIFINPVFMKLSIWSIVNVFKVIV